MHVFILTWFFILGAIVGSFLNVVAYRLGSGRSMSGRSHCTSCEAQLRWYELVPMFSYLVQRGRCRKCAASIAVRYLVVEVVTALLFTIAASLFLYDPVLLALALGVISLLVVIGVYDARHTVIPDVLVFYLFIISIVYVSWDSIGQTIMLPGIETLFGGIVSAMFFFVLWYFSNGRWMGLGDAKLAFPLGLMLGIWGSISMLILSFWIGAVVSVGLLCLQKIHTYLLGTRLSRGQRHLLFLPATLTIKSEVPFAPFLIAAFFLVFFWHVSAFSFLDTIVALFVP